MGLREDQILRYSRQILLPDVGGAGQERLLAAGFRLVGEGAGQEVAAAYLAAAGCAVTAAGEGRAVRAGEPGFLLTHAHVGTPLAPALGAAVAALNPDAAAGAAGVDARQGEGGAPRGTDWGELGEAPARFTGRGTRVALGALPEGGAGVAWAAAGACAGCLEARVALLGPGLSGPLSVVAGSAAALVAERLALGLSPAEGLVQLDPDTGLTPREAPRCGRCT